MNYTKARELLQGHLAEIPEDDPKVKKAKRGIVYVVGEMKRPEKEIVRDESDIRRLEVVVQRHESEITRLNGEIRMLREVARDREIKHKKDNDVNTLVAGFNTFIMIAKDVEISDQQLDAYVHGWLKTVEDLGLSTDYACTVVSTSLRELSTPSLSLRMLRIFAGQSVHIRGDGATNDDIEWHSRRPRVSDCHGRLNYRTNARMNGGESPQTLNAPNLKEDR